jgi:hypothetical protein
MIDVKDIIARLTAHPLYRDVRDERALRVFMRAHVFCVWDFMSLLKWLQRELTCVTVPWLPGGDPEPRRFINEIVVAEESDPHPDGGYASHYELYVDAMRDCGADLVPFEVFRGRLHAGEDLRASLDGTALPAGVREFVGTTFDFIETGAPHVIAAAFTYGREDVIPDMFRRLVRQLAADAPPQWRKFLYYLERHIEVDGDSHGPIAHRLIASLCGNDANKWCEANRAARRALEARIRLWDSIRADIGAQASLPTATNA